jgi:succinate dehydrogenase/fumarate reductase cytochrome b subunit
MRGRNLILPTCPEQADGVGRRRVGPERYRSALRRASLAAGAVLVVFHGWLFAGQIADGSLADPWLVFRWVAAAGLVAALAAVRARGGSLWGRHGVAIWVLAAMLHGPAVAANPSDALDSLALPETAVTSILQLVISVTAGLGLWLLAAMLAGRRRRQPRPLFELALAFAAAGILADGFSPPYSSRPPPQKS